MKHFTTIHSTAVTCGRVLAATLATLLLLPAVAEAAESPAETALEDQSGWSINFTPVLVFPKGNYGLGGGVDPELKYTLDLGGARLSAGARIGGYYVKDTFGLMSMPTLRLMVPVGPVEPYVAFGMGYGWIPKTEHGDLASMSRVGVVFRINEDFKIGLEGAFHQIEGSDFRFPAVGSMISFDL